MKNLKKFFCVLIATVMLFSLTVPAFADNQISTQPMSNLSVAFDEGFGPLLDCVLEVDTNMSPEDYQVMKPVTFNGSTNIYHFPITNQTGEVKWIYSVALNEDGSYGSTMGEDFAPLLNAVLDTGNNQAVLIQEGWSLYAITGNNVFCQQGATVVQLERNEIAQLDTALVNNSAINNLQIDTNYSTRALVSYQSFVSKNDTIYAETSGSTVTQLTNYPHIYNDVDGLCWAATVASMVRYEKPTTYANLTAAQVADSMGVEHATGGTPQNVVDALEYYLGSPYVPTYVERVLTNNEIMTVIDNNDPAYMRVKNEDQDLKHGIALIGYNITSTSARVKVMDPAFQNTNKFCTLNSSGDWQVMFGATEMYWYATVRLLYS